MEVMHHISRLPVWQASSEGTSVKFRGYETVHELNVAASFSVRPLLGLRRDQSRNDTRKVHWEWMTTEQLA